jgi:predicted nucleic acid-binding protein
MTEDVPPRPAGEFVVVDTMVASAILVGSRRPREAELLRQFNQYILGRSLILSFATVAELRYGALWTRMQPARVQAMETWFHSISVVMPDDDLVRTCAQLRSDCRTRGHGLADKIHESDRWIASTALRHGVPLASVDTIFVDIPGLQLLRP